MLSPAAKSIKILLPWKDKLAFTDPWMLALSKPVIVILEPAPNLTLGC